MWGISLIVVIFGATLVALCSSSCSCHHIYVATRSRKLRFCRYCALGRGGVCFITSLVTFGARVNIWLNLQRPPLERLPNYQSLYSIADGGLAIAGIDKGMPTLILLLSLTLFALKCASGSLGQQCTCYSPPSAAAC